MKAYVQILGAGSRECASHSLYYFLDQHRMLFNVSEGFQRLATQLRLKISPNRLSAIFLTRLDWECFGGLPGLILTMGDTARLIQKEKNGAYLRIIGPKHTKHAVAAMRPFLHRRDFSVEIEELCVESGISHWHDSASNVNVWSFELREASFNDSKDSDSTENTIEKVGNVVSEEMEPHHFLLRMFESEFSVKASQMERDERCEEFSGKLAQSFSYSGRRILVYVVQGPFQPGKFDRAAAEALGIKPGPLYGKLSRGETVTLENGTKVSPENCVGPRRLSPAYMILDMASIALVNAAIENISKLKELMRMPEKESGSDVQVVIHMLGEEVARDAKILTKYRQFCVELASNYDVKHFFTAPNDAILMSSSVDLQVALGEGLAAKQYFPSGKQPANYMEGPNMLKVLERIIVAPDESVMLEPYQGPLSGISLETDLAVHADSGVWVSTLGTGSAIPGKYRNVSSSFIENYETGEMIFLDCGEMTIGQMRRLFGPVRVKELLAQTTAILISHKHGDHHLGAMSLIAAINNERRTDQKLLLIAPERFKIWLEEFSQVSNFGLSRIDFVSCGDIREDPFKLPSSGTLIKAFDVDHCHEAFGFQITFGNAALKSTRVVYSGDTRPCDSVIDNAHECDLLVHEATMSNDLLGEAIFRKHCTIEEAVQVGVKSKCRALLLTHFSQRYAKGALSLDQSKHENVKVAMGVDLLRFPLLEVEFVASLADEMSNILPVDKEDIDVEMAAELD